MKDASQLILTNIRGKNMDEYAVANICWTSRNEDFRPSFLVNISVTFIYGNAMKVFTDNKT